MRQIALEATYDTNIVMLDSAGAPVTGLGTGDITVTYYQPDGTTGAAAKTNFAEVGNGIYSFQFGTAEVGTNVGELTWVAVAAGALNHYGLAQITVSGAATIRIATALVSILGTSIKCSIFLQTNGQFDSTGTTGKVTVYKEDGTEAIAEQTDASADAQGMFTITVDPHGLLKNKNYLMKVEVISPSGTVTSYQGFSVV
jgi:hypothetical protein